MWVRRWVKGTGRQWQHHWRKRLNKWREKNRIFNERKCKNALSHYHTYAPTTVFTSLHLICLFSVRFFSFIRFLYLELTINSILYLVSIEMTWNWRYQCPFDGSSWWVLCNDNTLQTHTRIHTHFISHQFTFSDIFPTFNFYLFKCMYFLR